MGSSFGIDVPAYLTGVIEYIVAEILDLSGNYHRRVIDSEQQVRINVRDLKHVIEKDKDLNNLKTLLNFDISGETIVKKQARIKLIILT